MDQNKFDQAVIVKKQIRDMTFQRDGMLQSFDSMILSQNISDPYFINMANSLRSNLAAYFDAKIAPMNDQFNAL